MKAKLLRITLLFAVLFALAALILFRLEQPQASPDRSAQQIVALNEIRQLAKSAASGGDAARLALVEEKLTALQEELRAENPGQGHGAGWLLLSGGGILYLLAVLGYVYFAVLRPFDKMKRYADHIARGEFDLPLRYERSNYFGEFTWAFDSMRREITKARACEQEAIENNKTVIATLSHDIKTPIASIRAYAEGLEANLDKTPAQRARYLEVILRKCDEVAGLTNDLFLHSLSDLDKLQIRPEPVELCGFLRRAVDEISAERGDVLFSDPGIAVMVSADRNRLLQAVENLINNARKYAAPPMDISVRLDAGDAVVSFRDYGSGIPDEDMPFIFDKFYRGRNCGSQQGSGLGLYIIRYVMHQMKGQILLRNHPDGLEALLIFPLLKEADRESADKSAFLRIS